MPKPRSMSFDLPLEYRRAPCAGDILTTARLDHEVTEARPVDSRVWGNRWRLTLRVLGARNDQRLLPDTAKHWWSSHYKRGETPASFFANRE